ncbi:MAG: sigma-70 family RNA polymerase sigma factor [Thermodesulfobacteriota bacterium]
MRKFKNGDEGSFDHLLGRHGAGVLRFIIRMTGAEKAQAEDLLQEIFMKVIERRKKYDPGQKFSTWLYSIARNHCIDYLRTESYRRHSSLDAPLSMDEEGGAVVIDIVRSGDRDQEERVFDLEVKELIDIGVRGLKEEFREVFLLREIEGLSFEEIAVVTASPLGTVKSRLRYAYKGLRQVFAESGYFEERQKAKGV